MQAVEVRMKQSVIGPMMYLPHDTYVGRSIDLYGEFSSGEREFFKFISRGGAAIDVGANIGAHSVAMALCYAHVYCFEPQEVLYRLLRANLALHNNSTCYNAAVGEQEGVEAVPMFDYTIPNNYGGIGRDAYRQLAASVKDDVVTVPMQIRQLDKVEAIQRESQIDLIKIDVEGMEKEVLLGAQATLDRCKPILYVENDKTDRSAALVQVIYNLGYKAFWHITTLYNAGNFAGNTNNIWPGISSFNLICIPPGHWLTLTNALECTPDNPGLPAGCVA